MADLTTEEIAELRGKMRMPLPVFYDKRHLALWDALPALLDAAERCAAAEAQAKAAGELLRVCNAMLDDEDYCYPETLPAAVEAAERAGVKP